MTDDRHYDLSITIVPGITAPRKLQLIANIDCPRRRNCLPPGVTHNASAPKICRGQPGAKTDSPATLSRLIRDVHTNTRGRSFRSIANFCVFFRFSFFLTIEGQSARQLASSLNCVETKAIVPLGNNGGFLFVAKRLPYRPAVNIIKNCSGDVAFRRFIIDEQNIRYYAIKRHTTSSHTCSIPVFCCRVILDPS